MKAEVMAGANEGTKVFSLDELIAIYEVSNMAEGKSPKTTSWYTDMLAAFAGYVAANHGSCDLTALNVDTARAYILYLRQKPRFKGHPHTPAQPGLLSPKTLQCHTRVLKAFCSWLYADGYTIDNRLKNLKLPKAPVTVMEPLTPGEIETIIAGIDKKSRTGARNHAILVTMLDTGLRASEAAGITLANLNLPEGFIKVMYKGAKERIVPIGKYSRMVLWSYIDKVRAKPTNPDSKYLFLTAGSEPITVNTIKLLFSRLAKVSGVARLHAHLCRHTFAINYLLNGGDVFSLQRILGHSSLEIVRIYVNLAETDVKACHRRFSPADNMEIR